MKSGLLRCMSGYDKDGRKGIGRDATGYNSRRIELIGKHGTLFDSYALEC